MPDYWIPFQPQRIDPSKPDIRLRRAAALLDEGGEPGFSRPLGRILEPERRDLSLFEEEVPRSGAAGSSRRFEYARWVDGSTFLWLARRKGAGAGEGSSGLRFDLRRGGLTALPDGAIPGRCTTATEGRNVDRSFSAIWPKRSPRTTPTG